MKIENNVRDKQGVLPKDMLKLYNSLRIQIQDLYKDYKNEDIDYDSFHLLICDLSNTERAMGIAIDACE